MLDSTVFLILEELCIGTPFDHGNSPWEMWHLQKETLIF